MAKILRSLGFVVWFFLGFFCFLFWVKRWRTKLTLIGVGLLIMITPVLLSYEAHADPSLNANSLLWNMAELRSEVGVRCNRALRGYHNSIFPHNSASVDGLL